MSWAEQDINIEQENNFTTHNTEPVTASGLFIGDASELSLETRRVLVQLLSGPSLDGRRHTHLWPIMLREEAILRNRLADLFLELVIDRDLQIAFTRQADTNELDTPTLLRKVQLTFIDSVLLLYLRHQLMHADSRSERAVIDTKEITEHLLVYKRSTNNDHAGFAKRMQASIEKMKKYNILQKIRGGDNRFEISPTLKLLFSAEEIQALTKLYIEKNPTAESLIQDANVNE